MLQLGFQYSIREKNVDPSLHIFLVGEAAGLASVFTGEGIDHSLVSGEEVARMIMDPSHHAKMLEQVLNYNRILEKVMTVFRLAGPLKGVMQELLVVLLQQKWVRRRVNAGFSV